MFDFAIDYSVLHEAKKDLYALAERIGPQLKSSPFYEDGHLAPFSVVTGRFDTPIGHGPPDTVFGDPTLAGAFRSFYGMAEEPMRTATKSLKELGDVFGGVADAVFDTDAQMAEGLGVMGAGMGLDQWKSDKKAWEYRQAHASDCVPGPDGSTPSFCSAKDPGAPPTDRTIKTAHGSITTHLTLDDKHNVIREDTTVVNGDQRYTASTTYADGGKKYTTDTTYTDGTKTHEVTTVGAHGSTTTDSSGSDGKVTHTVIELNESGAGTKTVTTPGSEAQTYTRTNGDDSWHLKVTPAQQTSIDDRKPKPPTESGPKGP